MQAMRIDKSTTMEKQATEDTRRFYWIDWARFLAAFAVLLTHARSSTWVNWAELPQAGRTASAYFIYTISRFGHEAVIIFFVLSGYLVGGKLIERVRTGAFDVRKYALDRAARIYVPYFPALIFSAIVWNLTGGGVSATSFVINMLQLQKILGPSFAGNDALWSLAYEVWFYVIGGAFAAACVGAASTRTVSLMVGVFALGAFVKLFPIYLLCWMIGAFGYAAGSALVFARDWIVGSMLFVGGVCISQYASLANATEALAYIGFDAKSTPLAQVGFLVMCLGVVMVIRAIASRAPGSAFGLRIERIGASLAAGSYTLYLTHYPALHICEKLDPVRHTSVGLSAWMSFGLRLAASGIIAYVFYRLFESKTAAVKKWISARLTTAR